MEDSKTRPLLKRKASKGGWRSAIYIIVVEVLERLAYFGVAANLIIYQTGVLREPIVTAAKEINLWNGVSTLLCLIGAFVADSYLGRYRTVLISSLIYILGLVILTLSVEVIPTQFERFSFLVSLYLVAIGQGGHRPSVQALGADQFDEGSEEERKAKSSFFNWWFFGVCGAASAAALAIVNIQDHAGWTVGFGIATIGMSLSLFVFLLGRNSYRQLPLGGSPMTQIAQVFVAAVRKWRVKPGAAQLESLVHIGTEAHLGTRYLAKTNHFQFLDKAATPDVQDAVCKNVNNWRLCPVTQVEEVKLILHLLPLWLSCLMYGVALAQASTFFVKQCSTLDTHISSFKLSPASIKVSTSLMVLILVPLYDRLFVPTLRRMTRISSGITLLTRIGIGISLSIIAFVVAALVEMKRLKTAEEYRLVDAPNATIPLTVWWMVPQYVLFAVSDVFALVGIQEFFYDQMPDGMRTMGSVASLTIVGVGSLLSNPIISIVHQIYPNWLIDNLNQAHLDYFYLFLAGLSTLWFTAFLCLSKCYVYKQTRGVL